MWSRDGKFGVRVRFGFSDDKGSVEGFVGGVALWLERWSRPANFPYPVPDCWLDG